MKPDSKHYTVRLELARQLEYPQGDTEHGYELVVPLTRNGRLDVSSWEAHPRACHVRRFRRGEADVVGHLERERQGRWHFKYKNQQLDEGPSFRFENEQFSLGQYISVRASDGNIYEFAISAVHPAKSQGGDATSPSA